MKYQLTAHEARVIGCLLEKQVTTPEQYPLSVNAVVTACNQKTNREPVMSLSEGEHSDAAGYPGEAPLFTHGQRIRQSSDQV